MRTTVFSLLLLVILLGLSHAQNVEIPDSAFLYALIDQGVDTNGDSLISYAEAEAITALNVSYSGIVDMTGIEAFVHLVTLHCTDYQLHGGGLDSLDVSNNVALESLNCSGNNLTMLDFAGNRALKVLDCSFNPLTGLNLSNNTSLTELYCSWTSLTSLNLCNNDSIAVLNIVGLSLDTVYVWPSFPMGVEVMTDGGTDVHFSTACWENYVSIPDTSFSYALIGEGVDINGDSLISYAEAESKALSSLNISGYGISDLNGIEIFTHLDTLICRDNQLTSMDISKNPDLTALDCSDNRLTTLDVSNNPDLKTLDCSGNQLPSIDVSNNPYLAAFDCSQNPLTSLDLSKNSALEKLWINELPNLSKLCVWEIPFPPYQTELYDEGSPDIHVTLGCEEVEDTSDFQSTHLRLCTSDDSCSEYLVSTDEMDSICLPDTLKIELLAGDATAQMISLYNEGPQPYDAYNVLDISAFPDPQNLAVNFDGIDDHIQIEKTMPLEISDSITLEAWIRMAPGSAGIYPIISKGSNDQGCELYITSGPERRLVFDINHGEVISNSVLLENQWYHAAALYDGRKISIFLNGILDAAKLTSGSIETANPAFTIGSNNLRLKSPGYFHGSIDEVRIWACTRTARQIHSFMHKSLSGKENGLIYHYPFNGNSEKLVVDQTANSRGFLMNGASRTSSSAPVTTKINIDCVSFRLPVDYQMDFTIDFNSGYLRSGDYYIDIEVFSHDPKKPDITLPVHINIKDAPSFSMNLDSASCEQIEIYRPYTFELEVRNNGSERLVIDSICSDLTGSRIIPHAAEIDPGGNKTFILELYIRERQQFESCLTFYTNDPTDRQVILPIIGMTYKPFYLEIYNVVNDTLEVGDIKPHYKRLLNPDFYNYLYLSCTAITYESPDECHDWILRPDSSHWLTTSFPSSVRLAPRNSLLFDIILDASGLMPGDYYGEMTVNHSNPVRGSGKGIYKIALTVTAASFERASEMESQINIYPNPTRGIVTVETEIPGQISIEITSLNGKILYNSLTSGPVHQIDLSSFQKGLYFITVKTGNYVATEKIVRW